MPTSKEEFREFCAERQWQAELRRTINTARRMMKIARNANALGHKHAEKLTGKGKVNDPFREHALIDFYTGIVENAALRTKKETHEVLLVRKAWSSPNPARQLQRLKQ